MLPPLTENEDLNSFLYRLQDGVNDAIGLSVVPASPEANGYLYQFLFVKYANDNIGTGFSDSPVGKTYYGLCNRDTPTESTNPTDYTWYAAAFGASNNLYYKNIGGRKLQFDVNTAPIDYKWLLDNSLAIDLDNIVPVSTVTTVEILDAAITELKLAAAAVTANKTNIAAISSLTGELNSNTVTSLQIATDAVTNTKLAAGAVTANKTDIAAINAASGNLNSGTVNTAQIVANAVTNLEIAANAVTANKTNIAAINPASGNLTANSVTAGAIAAGTIVASDIAAGTITGANIAANTIAAGNIVAGTITSSEIAAGTIVASDIAAGTITGANIAANTIAAGNIVASTITATELATDSVISSKIQAGAVTAAKITVTDLAAINANMGNITAGSLTIAGSGGTPTISGTTMTGEGARIHSDGRFALGTPARNIVNNGTQINLNGFTPTITASFATGNLLGGTVSTYTGWSIVKSGYTLQKDKYLFSLNASFAFNNITSNARRIVITYQTAHMTAGAGLGGVFRSPTFQSITHYSPPLTVVQTQYTLLNLNEVITAPTPGMSVDIWVNFTITCYDFANIQQAEMSYFAIESGNYMLTELIL